MLSLLLGYTLLSVVLSLTYLPRNSAQVSPTALSFQPSFIKQSSCICDLTPSLCDPLCCCDSSCSPALLSYWNSLKLCLNTPPKASYRIPTCSSIGNKLSDLTSGLTHFVKVMHHLLCVQYSSSSENQYLSTVASPTLAQTKASLPSSSTPTSAPIYSTSPTLQKRFTLSRSTIPSGSCSDVPVSMYSSFVSSTCTLSFSSSSFQSACSPGHVLDPQYYYDAVHLHTTDSSTKIPVTLNSTFLLDSNHKLSLLQSPPSISLSSSSCEYHVYALTYTLRPSSPDTLQSVLLDVVLRRQTSFSSSSPIQIPFTTSLSLSSANNPQGLFNNGGLGYSLGDSLNIGIAYTSSGKTGIVQNKGNSFYFSSALGTCMESSWSSPSHLHLGQDAILSCSASYTLAQLKTVCSSSIYSNSVLSTLKNQLQYLGIFKKSNANLPQDWLKVQSTVENDLKDLQGVFLEQACKFKSPRVLIYYSKIGSDHGYQYRLNYAEVLLQDQYFTYTHSDSTQPQQFNYKLLINFLPLPQSLSYYKAALPSSNVYTPNDVLYPFYVASGSALSMCLWVFLLLVLLM